MSVGLLCPACQGRNSTVKDARATKGGTIRRRRECAACGHRVSTVEVIVHDGDRQHNPFNIDLERYLVETRKGLARAHRGMGAMLKTVRASKDSSDA